MSWKLRKREKIPWEGEFSLRSDLWAGLIASRGSFSPMVPESFTAKKVPRNDKEVSNLPVKDWNLLGDKSWTLSLEAVNLSFSFRTPSISWLESGQLLTLEPDARGRRRWTNLEFLLPNLTITVLPAFFSFFKELSKNIWKKKSWKINNERLREERPTRKGKEIWKRRDFYRINLQS